MPKAGSSQRTPRAASGAWNSRHLVEDLALVRERLEAVGEAGRDVEGARPSARQLDAPCQRRSVGESGRRSTITSKIAPARAAHQLGLRVRRRLPVQAAQGAAPARCRTGCTAPRRASRPCAANSSAQKVRAKKPRSSAQRLELDQRRRRPAAVGRKHHAQHLDVAGSARRSGRPSRGCGHLRDDLVLAGSRAGSARSRAAPRGCARARGSGCACRAGSGPACAGCGRRCSRGSRCACRSS